MLGGPGGCGQAVARWAAIPIVAWLLGSVLSWPSHLWMRNFLAQDAGDSLASALLATQGKLVNTDFGYPYGPVSLALQQVAVRWIHPGVLAIAFLEVAGGLALALALAWAIAKLDLGRAAAVLLGVAALMVAILDWPPVYELEAAALAWALVMLAAERRGTALSLCVIAVLCKPSMGYVVGLLLVIEAVMTWRRGRIRLMPTLLAPTVTAAVALAGTAWLYGWDPLLTMLWSTSGMRGYAASGYTFFARSNPLLVGSVRLELETSGLGWLLATLGLVFWVVRRWNRAATREEAAGWASAAICAAATVAFILGFYGPPPSYMYYITLPLIGLAMLGRSDRRPGMRVVLVVIAGLILLGSTSALHADVQRWGRAHPQADAAGLWAMPAEAAAWTKVLGVAQRQGMVFVASGSPEASVPGLGPVWHGELTTGIAARGDVAGLQQRLADARCLAITPGWRLPEAFAELERARSLRPHRRGLLFDYYGCDPEGVAP